MSGNRLLIVGASGRAAAASAMRAGFEPFVIDLFADADTKRLCPVRKCEMADYPAGLVRLAEQAPPGPWMYTGGLENHPEVVAAISERRELWGNGPDQIASVRDPFRLAGQFANTTCRIPDVVRGMTTPPAGRRWVRKPLRGAGGLGISLATNEAPPSDRHFYQAFIPGDPVSVLYVSADRRLSQMSAADCRWPHTIAVCAFRQLVGTSWLHAPHPFAYAGNVGPFDFVQLGPHAIRGLTVGWMNDHGPRLTGIWGADYVLTPDALWLIEVNPRCPASVEVVTHSRLNPFGWLAGCFSQADSLWKARTWTTWPVVVGKAIYYAPHRLTFPASGPWDESLRRCTDVWRRPDFADIPDPHAVIEPGHPVLTLLADGATEAAVLDTLKERAAELDRLFGFPTTRAVK